MGGAEHIAARPSWLCRNCGTPWPCLSARADLVVEFRTFPATLTVYLAGHLNDASADLLDTTGDIPPGLYARFVGWARERAAYGAVHTWK